jgi:hypothetical protein
MEIKFEDLGDRSIYISGTTVLAKVSENLPETEKGMSNEFVWSCETAGKDVRKEAEDIDGILYQETTGENIEN